MVVLLLILAWLGLCLGSFVNALVWRIHKKKNWVTARSQCPHCAHELAAAELVPVLSWVALRGRCRYCRKPISSQYPLVELAAAAAFSASYYFWPGDLHQAGQVVLLVTWLVSSVGLLALLVYDLRWMLLPSKVLYPTLAAVATGQLVYLIGFAPDKIQFLFGWAGGVAVASGVFWALYHLSGGRWIGYGDVRLGLITGSILHSPARSLLMIFMASLMGTLFVAPSVVGGRRNLSAKLPYGPFLIVAAGLSLLFGADIINWYKSLFSIN